MQADRQQADQKPRVRAGYCYFDGFACKVISMYDPISGFADATVISQKGGEQYATAWGARCLQHLGHREVELLVDAEPSLQAWAHKVASDAATHCKVTVIKAPRGSHQSMGGVERSHQALQGQVRTLLEELPARYGVRINAANAAMAWVVRHASLLLQRFQPIKTREGQTA